MSSDFDTDDYSHRRASATSANNSNLYNKSVVANSSEFNAILIESYKACPALYDCDHAEYKAGGPTKECWKFVASACNTTAQDCRIRWKALRDRYIKERKRRYIQGNDSNRKPWPLYDKMDFLDEFVEKQRQKYPKTVISMENRYRNSSNGGGNGMEKNSGITEDSYLENGDGSFDDVNYDGMDRNDNLSTNMELLKAIEETNNIVDESSISALYDNIAAVAASVANSSEENHIIDYKKNYNGFTNGCSTRKSPARNDFWNGLMKKANSKTETTITANGTPYSPTANETPSRKRPHNNIDETSPSSNVVEALRISAENLVRASQTILADNEETIFGRYVAAVLQKMPLEKRIQVKMQIFAALHVQSDDISSLLSTN